MKKLIFVFMIVGIIVCPNAFAAGDKTITSQKYVENQIATKQDKIPAVDTNTVITHTGTNGEIGEKGIYDSNGNYAEQQTSLVTAGDANTGINNALENEFICIDWDTDGTCLIWSINNQTEHPSSKNIFNLQKSRALFSTLSNSQAVKISNGWVISNPGSIRDYHFVLVEVGDVQDFLGKTLTVSAKSNCVSGGAATYLIGRCLNDTCTSRTTGNSHILVVPETLDGTSSGKIAIWLYITVGETATAPECTYYDIQVEEGSVATEYEPYQNLYIPQNQ